jgi:hypothetical protein
LKAACARRKPGANPTHLINSVNGVHLWSRTYDRELSKVFDLQEELAKDVAKALSIRLDVGEMNTARGGTTDIEASTSRTVPSRL